MLITDGQERVEVGRVSFVRQVSANPKTSFGDKVTEVLERADHAAEIVNEMAAELERLNEEREWEVVERAKERMQGLLDEEVGSRRKRGKMA